MGFEAALDSLLIGVIFFGANGELLLMNRSASEFVSEKDGLLATSTGLRAERPVESDLLARAVQQATRTVSGVSLGGTILVSRRTRPPLQVLISPVRHSNAFNCFTAEPVYAIAFVVDPSRRQRPAEDVLRAMFRLSPAECRVALLLSDGRAPKEIANVVSVTENTVRSQIKSILSKTGVQKQTQLIRLLLHYSAPAIQPQRIP